MQRNSLLLIGKARVPIIKFRENLSGLGLPCDISVGCVNGLHTVQWVRSQIQCYPLCVPLTVILKRFLEQRNMNEPVNGTSLQVSLAANPRKSSRVPYDVSFVRSIGRRLPAFGLPPESYMYLNHCSF